MWPMIYKFSLDVDLFQAIRVANDENQKLTVARKEKERELSKVKISKEDVDLMVALSQCTVKSACKELMGTMKVCYL